MQIIMEFGKIWMNKSKVGLYIVLHSDMDKCL